MVNVGALLFSLFFSLKDWTRIEGMNILDYEDKNEFDFVTRKPFPWNKITVPGISYTGNNEIYSPDSTLFKGFVIALASVIAISICYYCRKFCQCRKVCSSMPSNTQQSRRNLMNAARNSRLNPSRAIQHHRGYQRMTSERSPRSPRRHPRRNIELQVHKKGSEPSPKSSESPPDYSTVILTDLATEQIEFPGLGSQTQAETPPPEYDGNNTFK